MCSAWSLSLASMNLTASMVKAIAITAMMRIAGHHQLICNIAIVRFQAGIVANCNWATLWLRLIVPMDGPFSLILNLVSFRSDEF